MFECKNRGSTYSLGKHSWANSNYCSPHVVTPILSFQFVPKFDSSGSYYRNISRSMGYWYFFSFSSQTIPDSGNSESTLIGQTCFLLTPWRRWIPLKCNLVLKTYTESMLIDFFFRTSSDHSPEVHWRKYYKTEKSKAERDLLHLGFSGEQLVFTELFFSSLIWAVPGQI